MMISAFVLRKHSLVGGLCQSSESRTKSLTNEPWAASEVYTGSGAKWTSFWVCMTATPRTAPSRTIPLTIVLLSSMCRMTEGYPRLTINAERVSLLPPDWLSGPNSATSTFAPAQFVCRGCAAGNSWPGASETNAPEPLSPPERLRIWTTGWCSIRHLACRAAFIATTRSIQPHGKRYASPATTVPRFMAAMEWATRALPNRRCSYPILQVWPTSTLAWGRSKIPQQVRRQYPLRRYRGGHTNFRALR